MLLKLVVFYICLSDQIQVKAYAQLLESYRSLTLAYMAGRNRKLYCNFNTNTHFDTYLFIFDALSLTLSFLLSDAFGVTEAYMDQELCRFIASGRLHAKIDKVGEPLYT